MTLNIFDKRGKLNFDIKIDKIFKHNDKNYELIGFIVHIDKCKDSGHYVSYIKRSIEKNNKKIYVNKWSLINDSQILNVEREKFNNFMEKSHNGLEETIYVLLYRLKD